MAALAGNGRGVADVGGRGEGGGRWAVRTLIIDNYDSFTFNLFHLFSEVNGEEPVVLRNDENVTVDDLRRGFDNVVLSPGPGRPQRRSDFGLCADVVAAGA